MTSSFWKRLSTVYVTVSGGYGQFFRRMSPGLAISYELWSCVCVRVFRRADSDAGAEMLRSSWQRDVSRDQAGEIMTGALRRPCTRRRRPTCAEDDDDDCSLPASVVMTSSLSPSMTSSIGEPENTQLRRPVSTSSITDNNWNAAVDGRSTPDLASTFCAHSHLSRAASNGTQGLHCHAARLAALARSWHRASRLLIYSQWCTRLF